VDIEDGQNFAQVGDYVMYEKARTGAIMRARADAPSSRTRSFATARTRRASPGSSRRIGARLHGLK